MKTTTKALTIKEKICNNCKLKKSCGDLPHFCILIYYGLIVLVVVMLSYFLITMNL